MEKDKKVTALYCRLSKDDGSNSESLSIRTQKAMLMEYATRNGICILHTTIPYSYYNNRSQGNILFRINVLSPFQSIISSVFPQFVVLGTSTFVIPVSYTHLQ